MSNDAKALITMGIMAVFTFGLFIWPTVGPPLWPSIITGMFTLGAAGLAAFVVFWQLRKQADNTDKSNRKIEAMKLKKEVYGEILPSIKKAAKVTGRVTGYLRLFVVELKMAQQVEKKGQFVRIPSARFFEFNKMLEAVRNAASKLMRFTEEWEIIEPRCDLFRIALHSALHDIETLKKDYQLQLTMAMPIENAEGVAYPWTATNLDIGALEEDTETFTDALITLASYIHDIRIEAQIFLLSDMFDKEVKRRVPLDQKYKVLRLDQYDELIAYFEATPRGAEIKGLNRT